jgi:deoxyribonuclease IV
MNTGPYIGAHMSVAGGMALSVERAQSVACQALQIFTKNSNQWLGKPLEKSDVAAFRKGIESGEIRSAFSHDSYLINLASPDPVLRQKSMDAFLDEMDRAEELGLDFVVFHPGAHLGAGIEAGCSLISEALNRLLDQRPHQKVKLLIENAAGQGSALGRTFEEMAMIRSQIENVDRVGFCFDTCHAFAAGYDLRTRESYEATMSMFDRIGGIENIRAFHLNDSKKGLDCRVDRHMHIGKGELGLEPFRFLLNDPRFAGKPMVLETPKSKDLHEDMENLGVLRSLLNP